MNSQKPIPPIDDDIGPLDEHGQQIWSPEEEAAIGRLRADPEYWRGTERAETEIAAERIYTSEQVAAHMAEVRRRYLAERDN